MNYLTSKAKSYSNKRKNIRAPECKYYPLSFQQQRIWFISQLSDKAKCLWNNYNSFKITKKIDDGALNKAYQFLIKRHAALRTRILVKNDEPVQEIMNDVKSSIHLVDMSEYKDLNQQKRTAEYLIQKEIHHPLDLSHAPLCRLLLLKLDDKEHILFYNLHHIVSDGSSLNIFIRELNIIYNSIIKGNSPKLDPINYQYYDYAYWQHINKNYILKDQEEYWLKQFNDQIPILRFPLDYPRKKLKREFEGKTQTLNLDTALTHRIHEFCLENGILTFSLILSGYALLLYYYTNQSDLIIGSFFRGRKEDEELSKIIGVFVNTLPLRMKISNDDSHLSLLNKIQKIVRKAYKNQEYPFQLLVQKLNLNRDYSRNPLFDVAINFISNDKKGKSYFLERKKERSNKKKFIEFDLNFNVRNNTDYISISIEYLTSLFRDEKISRMLDHFENILIDIVSSPNKDIKDCSFIPGYERNNILHHFNDINYHLPVSETIVELFEEQVLKNPQKIAIKFHDITITYHQIDTRANYIRDYLFSLAIKKEAIIGLMAHPSIEMIIGMIGILKAGCAYLPLNPEDPIRRNEHIITDSKTPLILADQNYDLPEKVEVQNINDIKLNLNSSDNQKIHLEPENLAYVIYTSGSTGTPKGVMVQHNNALNAIKWYKNKYKIDSETQVLNTTKFNFDPSVQQIFSTLIAGGTLHLLKNQELKDPYIVGSYLRMNNIGFVHFVPTLFKEIFHYLPGPENLKSIILGGEILNQSLKDKIISAGYNVYNHYGPAETSITSTSGKCESGIVTIGSPLPNTKIYILNEYFDIQPIGVWGEIFIAGNGVTRGYINQPEKTNEHFILNPFGNGKLYKTGDLARWLPDGNIEFGGRKDEQIKIHGCRIEPTEIEQVLKQKINIEDAVVIVREVQGKRFLSAYYVSRNNISQEDLKFYMSSHLPTYMIPAYFTRIEKIPLTSSGKIDKFALPEPKAIFAQNKYVEPSNSLEKQLVEVWEKVLNQSPIGVTDNFFKIGGNSLLAITLINKIEKKFGEQIPISAFFKNLTIRQLANLIYQLFSWSAKFHIDAEIIENKKIINSVQIANLQTKGDNPPLFFVAPLGGILPATSIVGIMDLPLQFGENQPFYSIQVPPLFPNVAEKVSKGEKITSNFNIDKNTLNNFVDESAQKIKGIYQGKNILMGGFCSGSLFTMLLTEKLEQMNYNVKNVFLIDPPLKLSSSKKSIKSVDLIPDPDKNLRGIAWFIAKDIGWKENIDYNYVVDKLNAIEIEDIWDLSLSILKQNKTIDEKTTTEDLKTSYYTKFYNQELLNKFISNINFKYPQINADSVTFIFSENKEFLNDQKFNERLYSYFKNQLVVEEVPGDHGTVFQHPNIEELVKIIKKNIKDYHRSTL